MTSEDTIKPGTISYISKIPPLFNHQIQAVKPPEIIPAKAAGFVVLFQNNEKSTIGPKAAPNPDHAKATNLKTDSFILARMLPGAGFSTETKRAARTETIIIQSVS